MRTKKTAIAIMVFSAIVTFAGVNFASAQSYTPLVQIPGIPLGPVNLSLYLVGLYDFLLSIVGIVAVLMLIVGGMRYITAAGNQAAVSDAKDIITNALVGLLLAILSWVIVAEINPDVLYIKKPGGEFAATVPWMHGLCMDPSLLPLCICKDGTAIAVFTDVKDCDNQCRTQNHCGLEKMKCTYTASYDVSDGDSFYNPVDKGGQGGRCHCIDGMFVEINYGPAPQAPADATCEDVCTNHDWAGLDSDGNTGDYHGINWDLRIGKSLGVLCPAGETTISVGEIMYYDFSNVRDCRGTMIHMAVDFDGGPFAILLVDEQCCLRANNPACGLLSGWGVTCNTILGVLPRMCYEDGSGMLRGTHIFPPPNGTEYPIYKHSYGAAGLRHVWTGVSYRGIGGNCHNAPTHLFKVDVLP